MGTTVPSVVEGGSDQEKKRPDEKFEGDEPGVYDMRIGVIRS